MIAYRLSLPLLALVGVAAAIGHQSALAGKKSSPGVGLTPRVAWTKSRIAGSPDPPHPYRIERAFPRLTFKNPLHMTRAPGIDRFFVTEQAGRIVSFRTNQQVAKADLFFDLTKELSSWDKKRVKRVEAAYALVFHPRFEKNRYCYICYVLESTKPGEQLAEGSRIARFRVTDTDPPRVDPKSEKIIITWLAGGHNGCDLHFGPDGFLYISTGDGTPPNPPDGLDTGQDLTDLLSSILRIDVDRADKGKPYAVPPDNPFIKTPKARPEIWAYGFRNPWRMSFDRVTGDLWVGDVGWELWEMVYRVQKGGNYGWPVMEGRQPVKPEGKRGPTPILPPTLDFPHTEAASITGGYVYHGKKFTDLVGAYICGDWVTRKVWGTRFMKRGQEDHISSHRELAQGGQRVVAFAEDTDGELFIVHYDEKGSIHQLVANEAAKETRPPFPTRLSETGLFASVPAHIPAAGVVPFSIQAEQWQDHATAERFLGLPGTSKAKFYDAPVDVSGDFFRTQVVFPKDGVLAKTISLEMERGEPKSRRRLETQVLHFDGLTWRGYTYAWNGQQTDAVLVGAKGMEKTFSVVDRQAPGGKRKQTWHFPSRTECLLCHNPWTGFTLAFTPAQVNREHRYNGAMENQVRTLTNAGYLSLLHKEDKVDGLWQGSLPDYLVGPSDSRKTLEQRARSYLHANCSHCHQWGGGGTANLDLRATTSLDDSRTLEAQPVQGSFDIADAQILAPGDPYRSILYYRMARLGPGHMPHLGSEIVDRAGLKLIHDWIRQLPIRKNDRALRQLPIRKNDQALLDRLMNLDETTILAGEKTDYSRQLKDLARNLERKKERLELIGKLLSTPSSSLLLLGVLDDGRLPASIRSLVLEAVIKHANPQVRDLFERFLPDEQRSKRLGALIRPEKILAQRGDAERGKELFFKSEGMKCATCHRVNGTGSTLGPDLSQIAKKMSREKILENILEPSKEIDPKYASYALETAEGVVHTGILAAKTEREVVLRTSADKEIRIPAARVVNLQPLRVSLMPDQLLRDLTLEQAADLLEFLAALK